MNESLVIDHFIEAARRGSHYLIPFKVPEEVETIKIKYAYERRADIENPLENGIFHSRPEINIIDLGLINANGWQVGASGSDKTEITISETDATPGYHPCRIVPGEWNIIVGAYKVQESGVKVRYEITFTTKKMRLLKGDLHTHTVASDGVHTAEELAIKAKRNGLDFMAITDHNQMISQDALPHIPGVTVIPGVEWTHYNGHANFLGLAQPYDQPFFTNTAEEARSRFSIAHQRGALITANHPFEPGCEFLFDLNDLPIDCLEVWNGPMRESNLRAVGLWQRLLAQGRKMPITGGSDYHRDTPFIFLGGPTMGVYAKSAGASDIVEAIRLGHAFITFAPNGPEVDLRAGESMMGDSVRWSKQKVLTVTANHLQTGDILRVVTINTDEVIFQAATPGDVSLTYKLQQPGLARVEILRSFLPGVPMLPALISNPIYFDVL